MPVRTVADGRGARCDRAPESQSRVDARGSTWHPLGVRWMPLAIALALGGCQKDRSLSSAAAITDRSWKAHVLVIDAGERATTCAEAGVAMQRAFADHRQAFADAMALDKDKARLAEATEFIEANEARYADIDTRMAALSDRCADDPTVRAVFRQISDP